MPATRPVAVGTPYRGLPLRAGNSTLCTLRTGGWQWGLSMAAR